MWRLLNEKMEPPPIDFRQPGGRLRHNSSCPRAVIDQSHLTNQRAWHVQLVAPVAFQEKDIAGRDFQRVGFLAKKFSRIHGVQRLQRTNDICQVTIL